MFRTEFVKARLALMALALSLAPWARAQGAPGDSARLEELDQKVRILERKLEVKEEAEQAKAPETPKVTASLGDGFAVKSADGDFSLRWRGFLQADWRGFVGGNDTGAARTYLGRYPNDFPNSFLLRKARPYFDATLFKYASLRIVPDFGNGALSLIDAYGEVGPWPWLRLRAGKFIAPIGLERLQPSTDNFFPEFSHVTSLVPNRDLGAQLSGDLPNESFGYAVGVFNGAADGANKDNDSTDHKDIVGRVWAQPFKNGNVEPLRNLGVGFAASWGRKYGDSVAPVIPSFRTPGQNTFFQYRANAGKDSGTVRADGIHYRLNPEGYWFAGSFGLLGEYVFSSQEVLFRNKAADPRTVVENKAWLALASYVLTGEQPSFKGLKPRHPLAPDGSGFGAFELVARASRLQVGENAFPVFADSTKSAKEALSFGGGVNWYLSRLVKWSFDYELTKFKGGAKTPAADRDDEQVLTSQLQFAF